jgi:hypothetical protein
MFLTPVAKTQEKYVTLLATDLVPISSGECTCKSQPEDAGWVRYFRF